MLGRLRVGPEEVGLGVLGLTLGRLRVGPEEADVAPLSGSLVDHRLVRVNVDLSSLTNVPSFVWSFTPTQICDARAAFCAFQIVLYSFMSRKGASSPPRFSQNDFAPR